MRAKDIKPGSFYEAKVPFEGPAKSKSQYRTVMVIGVGDSYEHGNAEMIAVVYATPLSPRGTGIALVNPQKVRLRRARLEKNEAVASPDR